MFTINTTDIFDDWLEKLDNHLAKNRILARIRNAYKGHFGDSKSVGEGVYEMRVHIRALEFIMLNKVISFICYCVAEKSLHKKKILKKPNSCGVTSNKVFCIK